MLFSLLLMNNGRLTIIRLLVHNSGFSCSFISENDVADSLVAWFAFHHFYASPPCPVGRSVAVLHHFMGHCSLIVSAHIHHCHTVSLNSAFQRLTASDGRVRHYLRSCMFIVSAAMADEATAIMATNDTRIFSWLGLRCFHTQTINGL